MFVLAESQGKTVTLSTTSVPLTSGYVISEVMGRAVICTRKRTSPSMAVVQLELLTLVFAEVPVSCTIPLHFSLL